MNNTALAIESMIVELIDVCNLNCSYCLRDEASLHGKAHALPIPELARILAELRRLAESHPSRPGADRCQRHGSERIMGSVARLREVPQ